MISETEFSNDRIPIAYFITFRCYGSWLHGRAGSVDRFHNSYGTKRLERNRERLEYNQRSLKRPPVKLGASRRAATLAAIKETCTIRNWDLWAANIRSNHVHTVVSAPCKPDGVLNAFKANATRKMREAGCWFSEHTPWVRKGSKIYLWTESAMQNAVGYVLYDQGEPLD